jgi:hypothetical protein
VEYLNNLREYFKLKAVPESMKLPLAIKSVTDSYASQRITSVSEDIKDFNQFSQSLTELLWNQQIQAGVRGAIFHDKYDKRTKETLSEHFLRYAVMAAHLQPRLSELDLINAIGNHFPTYIQRALLSANLGSTQQTLNFLRRMEGIDGSQFLSEGRTIDQSSRSGNDQRTAFPRNEGYHNNSHDRGQSRGMNVRQFYMNRRYEPGGSGNAQNSSRQAGCRRDTWGRPDWRRRESERESGGERGPLLLNPRAASFESRSNGNNSDVSGNQAGNA